VSTKKTGQKRPTTEKGTIRKEATGIPKDTSRPGAADSDGKFKRILDAAAEAIVVFDREGKISYWNRLPRNFWGTKRRKRSVCTWRQLSRRDTARTTGMRWNPARKKRSFDPSISPLSQKLSEDWEGVPYSSFCFNSGSPWDAAFYWNCERHLLPKSGADFTRR